MREMCPDHRELLKMNNLLLSVLPADEDNKWRVPMLKVVKYWVEKVLSAEEDGKKVIYNQFNTFAELFNAFDLLAVPPEIWSLLKSYLKDGYGMCDSIDVAHEAGIHPELCSAHKSSIGDILRGDQIPPPVALINPSYPCDNTKIAYQVIAEITGAPIYVMDCPYFGPDTDEEAAVEYWVNQFKGLISFLEEISGQKLDPDRLKEVANEANRAVEYILEEQEMRKLKPCPTPGLGYQWTIGADSLMGLPEYTECVKMMRDETKERVEKGKTAVPGGKEKLRVNWFYLHAAYDMNVTDWLEAEKGASSPVTFTSYATFEPIDTSTTESIIRGMARRMLTYPMGRQGTGSSEIYIQDCIDTVRGWGCDCVILSGHAGCKYLRGIFGLFRDELRKINVPLLVFDCDSFDPRVAPVEEFRPKIEEFVDMVIASKERENG